MKKKLLILCLLIITQTNAQLDSIKRILRMNINDSIKIQKAIYYIDYANLDFAEKISLLDYLENNSPISKSKKTQGFYLFQRGQLYYDYSKYDEAVNFLYNALPLAEETNDYWLQSKVYNYLGIIFSDQGNNKKAVSYFKKTYEIALKLNDINQQFVSANNLAVDLTVLGEHHKAIYYLGKAEEILRNKKTKTSRNYLLSIFGNKMESYMALKDEANTKAQHDSIESRFRLAQNHLTEDSISYHHFMGEYFVFKNDYKTALNYFEKNIKIVPENDYNEKIKLYKNLQLCYVKTNNYQMAYKASLIRDGYKDSISGQDILRKSVEQEGKYNNLKIENELQISKLKNANDDLKLKRNKIIMLFGSLFTLLLIAGLVVFYRLYKDNKRKNLLLTEKNEIIEEKQKEILASIRYAKRIQDSLLPSNKYLANKIAKKDNGSR